MQSKEKNCTFCVAVTHPSVEMIDNRLHSYTQWNSNRSSGYLRHPWCKDTQSCPGRCSETNNCGRKDRKRIVVLSITCFSSKFWPRISQFSVSNFTIAITNTICFHFPPPHAFLSLVKLTGMNKTWKKVLFLEYNHVCRPLKCQLEKNKWILKAQRRDDVLEGTHN